MKKGFYYPKKEKRKAKWILLTKKKKKAKWIYNDFLLLKWS